MPNPSSEQPGQTSSKIDQRQIKVDFCPGTEQKAIILLSGGIDSYTCLKLAMAQGYICEVVYFIYGQKYDKEYKIVKNICSKYGLGLATIQIPTIWGGYITEDDETYSPERAFLPGRNTIFLLHAALLAYSKSVQHLFIAVHKAMYEGQQMSDSTESFIVQMQSIIDTSLDNPGAVKLQAPFVNLYKSQVIALGQRLGANLEITSSCYKTSVSEVDCGKCDGCQTRNSGFLAAQGFDPTVYETKTPVAPNEGLG